MKQIPVNDIKGNMSKILAKIDFILFKTERLFLISLPVLNIVFY